MPPIKSKSKDKNKKIVKKSELNKVDNLNFIRNKIDVIDQKIHKLIMQRSIYVKNIAFEKSKNTKGNSIIYRPAREHEVLMALINRHSGEFPKEVLLKLWRTMIGAYISMQGKLKVSYVSKLEVLVKDYFGITMDYNKITNIKKSISILPNDVNHILVLPLPSNKNNWWQNLLSINSVNIIGNLYDNLYEDTKGYILSSQALEFSKHNKVIYITLIKNVYERSFDKYLSINNYSILAKASKTNKEVIILFAKNSVSQKDALKNLNDIKKNSVKSLVELKIIGAVSMNNKERN